MTGARLHDVRSRRIAVAAAAAAASLLLMPVAAPTPALAASGATACASDAIALTNAGFESPAIPPRAYRFMSEANVPGWSTTASDRQIELWSNGFNGVPAAEGSQFAELNANMTSALFQDVETTPGTAVTWSLAHRGRAGVDTMRVVIGPPGGPLHEVARMSDGTSGWGRHSGTYVIPARQTVTRFAFEAVSTASGDPTVGNFLDDIAFGTPACIVLSKRAQVIGEPVPGGKVRWSITATNKGGGPAESLVINDSLPMHSTYSPGSLRAASGPRAGGLTDAADSDAGTVAGTSMSWRPVGASNIAGRLNPGESATVSFDTVIKASGAGATIANTATATYAAGGEPESARSNIADVTVAETSDVYVTKLFDSATVTAAAGSAAANFSIVVGNHGPFAADAVMVTDLLPAGLSVDAAGITVAGAAGSCSVAAEGGQDRLICKLGTLSAHAIRVVTVPATFTKATPGAVTVENTASVSTSTFDTDPANNASSSEMVFDPGAAADVAVAVTAATAASVFPGDEVGWVINVFNATAIGLSATGVTVTATLPTGVTDAVVPANCTLAAPTVTCAVGTLDAGGRAQILIGAKADSGLAEGSTVTLSATVTADPGGNSDPTNDTDSASIGVTRPGELSITKRALDPVTQGQTRFEVTVTSIGQFEARNVTLTESFGNATVVSTPEICDATASPVTCDLGTMEVGQTTTLEFTFVAKSLSAAITNTASVKADNADEVSASTAAARIVPEFGEDPLPGGLPAAPAPPEMARTGADSSAMLGLSALLVALGVALVRRRRSRA
ncbi:MAG: DUF11 domain-containing protein [Actinomycetales bacterium]|nr:DUF11 domain-containing protein [Actinomycetales bacterium]